MKSGVGNKRLVGRRIVILFSILIIASIMDIFSLSTYVELKEEDLNQVDNPQENLLPPKMHGVRSSTPSWSSLSGSLPSTNDYHSIDFGDVNNDGKLDVIFASGQTPRDGVHCYLGDGNGGWTENSTGLPTTNYYPDLEVDDLNKDGNLDIICNRGVWTGNGGQGGTMIWTPQIGPLPAINWYGVALGDVDNNGTIDIVAGTDGGVRVWTSNGGLGGSFVWTPASNGLPSSLQYWGVDFGDVNNDGNLDVLAASHSGEGVKVWTGNGESGSLAFWTDAYSGTDLPISDNYAQVRFGDANNDGNLDIAFVKDPGGARFFKGNGGDGGFSWVEESNGLTTQDRHMGISFGDVNNDGKLDLVAGNYSGGNLEVWLGDGGVGGALDWISARDGLPDGTQAIDVCLGDVNNDGRLDIGVTTFTQGVQIWAGNLPDLAITGWSNSSTGLPMGSGWYDVDFGDINHDGKLDIAAASSSGLGVGVWLGNGNGVWKTISDPDIPSSENYNGVRLTDINHDGNLDLIAANNTGNLGRVWLGNGTGRFGPDTGPVSSTPLAGVDVGDINNDGNLDIASSYYQPSGGSRDKVYIWNGTGDGGWGSDTGPPQDLGYDDVALGDVNHDGKADLFATGHMMGFRFWLGDGNGGWNLQPPESGIPDTGGGGLGACFGDVNHDGNLDIAIGAWVTGNFGIRVYTSDGGKDGDVNWTEESSGLPTSGVFAGVELGDINNDGDLDLLSGSTSGTNNGISLTMGNGGEGGSMVWTDALLPDLPSAGNYWGVDFGDVNNDGVLDIAITSANGVEVYITQTQIFYKIDLSEGWNLISLPLIQSETNVDSVFSTIDGQYNAVQCYDSSYANDPWKHYHTQKPSEMIDLTDVNHTMGIWIYVIQPGGTVLTVNGNEIGMGQSITIRPGWNLVGYPSKTDKLRDDALGNLFFDTDVDSIWTYDAATQSWEEIGPSDYFEVGMGYWIHSMRDVDIVWNVPL
ncbi:MAG: VCBS repeat-containing protein [Thermoplasmata archaeon]|nr:MAG: VCBS repeat-containing protein [Thermoplasmata archaeon]